MMIEYTLQLGQKEEDLTMKQIEEKRAIDRKKKHELEAFESFAWYLDLMENNMI